MLSRAVRRPLDRFQIHGCGACLVAHENELRTAGMGRPQIHEGLGIAAVVHAACSTLAAEGALAPA